MKLANFETYFVPSTVATDGTFEKFHPAVNHGQKTYYWANRTFDSEDAALIAAELAMNDAIDAVNAIIGAWNLTER